MSDSLPNRPRLTNASGPHAHKSGMTEGTQSSRPDAQAVEAQAVETFEFEVNAGRPTQLEGGDLATTTVSVRKRTMPLASEATRSASVDQQTAQPIPVAIEVVDPVGLAQVITIKPTAVSRRVGRSSAWWVSSLGLHGVLLVCLAFSTLAVMQEDRLELYVNPAVYEPLENLEEYEDLEIDPAEELDSLDDELSDPDLDLLEDLSQESLPDVPELDAPELSDLPQGESASADVSSNLTELGNLFGENGTGLTGMSGLDNGLGTGAGGAMAKFFGTEVKAKRILYMLDNSGGMRKGGKFEALVSELQASIAALQPKQKFYIIFYSDTVYPLFYPQSVRKFMPATDRNQKQLGRWLDSVELCTGNAIDEALAAAEVIRPDAVFLLTDGNLFTTEKKKALLLNRLGRPYSIHTFGLGVSEQTKTAEGLRQVAEANEGTFRMIKVSSETKALAEENQRPYHSKRPGPVWGLKVGVR